MILRIFSCFVALPAVFLLLASSVYGLPQKPSDVSFENDIKPIFENQCLSCHGPETEEAFRIDDRDASMDYISPGEPEESEIYTYLVSDDEEEMMPPPDEGGPLGDSDIQLVRRWIEQGADWPEGLVWDASTDSEEQSGADAGANEPSTKSAGNAADPKEPNIWNAIGSLHPVAIHLPLGLLFAAGLFALLSLGGSFVMSDCAYYCLWLGTLGAILACVTGWWFGPMENYSKVQSFEDFVNTDSRLFWHRTSGLLVTAAAVLVSLFAAGSRNKNPDEGVLWKLGVMLIALGIGYVGHEGGELTWDRDGKHYRDLNGMLKKYLPILDFDEKEEAGKVKQSGMDAAPNGDESMESATVKTSTETLAPDPSRAPVAGLEK